MSCSWVLSPDQRIRLVFRRNPLKLKLRIIGPGRDRMIFGTHGSNLMHFWGRI